MKKAVPDFGAAFLFVVRAHTAQKTTTYILNLAPSVSKKAIYPSSEGEA